MYVVCSLEITQILGKKKKHFFFILDVSLSLVTEHLAQTCNCCIPGLAGAVHQMADQNANDFYPTLCFFPKDGNS